MEKESEYFLAEIAARISTLEAEGQKYSSTLGIVRRNNGYRLFRKVIGVLLEIVCWLLLIAAVAGVLLVGNLQGETYERFYFDFLSHFEKGQKVIDLINALFLIIQLLIGLAGVAFAFLGYVLAKVRLRNSTIKDLTGLLESMVAENAEQLKRAKQAQMDFIRWKAGSDNPRGNPGFNANPNSIQP